MRRCLLFALTAGTLACWRRPAPPAPDREVAIGLSPETWSLPNGLRVVLVRDPRATQVLVTMVYGVGDADDPAGAEGTAHLVEHTLFEPVAPDGASLITRLQALAIDVNGMTAADTTAYTARVWPDRLPGLLALEAERLGHRCETVSEAAFARAREIVRNEFRQNGAAWQVRAMLDEALFPDGHPYHRGAATLASLGGITREQACAFADAHYGTQDAVLVVSGPVTRDELTRSLTGTLAAIDRGTPPVHRRAGAIAAGHDAFAAAVPSAAVLVTWPLPDDPVQRADTRAVVAMIARLVRNQINSGLGLHEIGGEAGRAIAIVISLAPEESAEAALAGVERARFRMQDWFGSGLFELARERAVYELVASVADGTRRDVGLAEDALAARDPGQTLAAELAALHAMSRDDARAIAERLTLQTAHVTRITPEEHPAMIAGTLAQPIDELPRPIAADPAAAHRPATTPARDPLTGLRTRTLASGLRVVLMPSTSVHTFIARLVFPAGAGDEPAGQRGVALLAAHALSPNPGDTAAMLHFYMGGGTFDVDVGFDSTTFDTDGLASQLDVALQALASLVGNGIYGDLEPTRRELAAYPAPDLTFTRLWRAALYGDDHPYVDAGLWRRATVRSSDAVMAFRATHYLPQGATLIVVGGFDPDLADRWIDYAFADWRGESPAPADVTGRTRALAFGQRREGNLDLHIAFPAHAPRPASLVAAAMLSRALRDVREELAASYGVSAMLSELRGGATIVVTGEIDAARAADACALIRDRIAKLRAPSPDTDARFVEARTEVIDKLVARPAEPSALADRIENAVALGREPDDDRRTAEAARKLTIDDVAPLLHSLDLQNAAMIIRGPQPAIDAAATAFGRHLTAIDR